MPQKSLDSARGKFDYAKESFSQVHIEFSLKKKLLSHWSTMKWNDLKAARRSDFSRQKTVHATRVTKEVFSSDFEAKAITIQTKRCSSETREPDPEEMGDLKAQTLKDLQAAEEIRDALEHGKSLRGKSAKSIEMQLKASALLNLSKSEELADIRKFQRESVHSATHDEIKHAEMMEERAKNLTDLEKLTEPLTKLSQEMKCYEEKSTTYYQEKR